NWGVTFEGGKYNVDQTKWQSGDNFLWNDWGIPGDSILVQGFITGSATYNGVTLFPFLLASLLGNPVHQNVGGWYGFVWQGGDWGGLGLAQLETIVWASNDSHKPGDVPPCSNPLNTFL